MDSSINYNSLGSHVQKTPEILECYSVLGEGSHILKIIAQDTEALEKLLSKIQSWAGVTRTNTHFILSTIKETTEIRIKPKE